MRFLHKVLGTKPNDGDIQPKEMISYSLSGFGQNLICGIVASYLMVFYTDALLLAPAAVSVLMLVARLFDAFNDPLMGSIVDKTRSRWGKLRPYLLFTPIPIAIMTVLCFTNMGFGKVGTLIYAYITYIIWGVLFTIIDVPYWGLSSAITGNTQKRTTLLTIARLCCTAGSGIVSIGLPIVASASTKAISEKFLPLINEATEAGLFDKVAQLNLEMQGAMAPVLSKTYFFLALAIAIVAAPMFLFGFFGTKERFASTEKAPKLSHNLKLLTKNKPLLLVMASGVLGALKMLYITMGIYFCKYNLGNETFFSVLNILIIPAGLIASVLTPLLTKKIGKKNIFIYSHILGALFLFLMFFVGYKSQGALIFFCVGIVVTGIPTGFANILTYAMIGDSVDYLELKTGERAEGICFSMQTFISKIGMAFTTFTCMITLAVVPYMANAASQSESVYRAIFITSTIVPGVSMLLSVIPLLFYKFNEKQQSDAIATIAQRKEIAKGTSGITDTALGENIADTVAVINNNLSNLDNDLDKKD